MITTRRQERRRVVRREWKAGPLIDAQTRPPANVGYVVSTLKDERLPMVVMAFAQSLRASLGGRLIGVYLGGSFSMGDFVENVSDYDVLVVVADPLLPPDVAALSELHERVLATYPDAVHLEGDYAPRAWLTPEGTREAVPYFRGGRLQPQPAFMLSADNIANMGTAAIVVAGLPASDVLPRVTPEHVRDAVRAMLNDIEVCENEAQAAGEILALVRWMRALETGAPATKSDGVKWALAHLDAPWHPIVKRADAVRRGSTPAANEATLRRGLDGLRALLLLTRRVTEST